MELDLGAGGTPTIPEELIDKILDLLWDDQEALKQSCLASRSFVRTCQKLIFECIWLEDIPSGGYLNGHLLTMAQRLGLLLRSTPHLALLINGLHIVSDCGNWLTRDKSLPFVLPLLVNLRRFYISNGKKNPDYIIIPYLPKAVQEALFATWRSPKLTHIGMGYIAFASFEDVLSVISQSSHSVRNIAICMVDGEDMEFDGQFNANHDSGINGQPVIPGPSSTRGIDSLTFTPCEDEHSAQFYTWLLNPKTNFSWSSLRKLHFHIGGQYTFEEDLSLFRHILTASPSIEELHISMYNSFGNAWTNSGPHEPVDISSIRVLHLVVDLIKSDLPILEWWCDNLTSALALESFEIYKDASVYSLPETPLDLVLVWKCLDEILSSADRDIKLKIRLILPYNGSFCLFTDDLRHCFPRMRDKGRLEVDCVDRVERHRRIAGLYWL
ncbi:hypothetical protein E1B28_002925 [Marasmius oreades]|nr:uncharacterized protein E1B28_002925 [Marasmius oreades]KAG7085362.1 hypothetical protein E1B28_002925 [Marasmius oreades]